MVRREGIGIALRADQGFSLIELLVAVAILSLAAVTMLDSQTQAVGMTSQVELRTLASVVAENRLNLALGLKEEPVPGSRTGTEEQMGVRFNWRESVRPAPGGDLTIIQVSVFQDSGQDLAELTGFRKAR